MVGVFGDEKLRHRRLGRQPALYQPRRRGRLHHPVFAGSAGIFGPTHDKHAELGRDDVEAFADILANPMQRALAARAGMIVNVDHHLEARQMRLAAGIVSAAGSVEAYASASIRGRFAADLKYSTGRAHANVSVSGSLKEPRFSR